MKTNICSCENGWETLRTKVNKCNLLAAVVCLLVFVRFTKLENLFLQGCLHINESVTWNMEH